MLLHFLHARRCHDVDAGRQRSHVQLDLARIQLSTQQHVAELVARIGVSRRRWFVGGEAGQLGPRQQHVEHALLGGRACLITYARHLLLARHFHRDIGQFLDDGVDLATDVAHLGELGGLHLDERSVGQSCQPPRDLGLAAARGADHQDVLGRDLLAQGLIHLHATPAVTQCNGHCTLGGALADDVLVQLLHDLLRGHSGSSSMVRLRLV